MVCLLVFLPESSFDDFIYFRFIRSTLTIGPRPLIFGHPTFPRLLPENPINLAKDQILLHFPEFYSNMSTKIASGKPKIRRKLFSKNRFSELKTSMLKFSKKNSTHFPRSSEIHSKELTFHRFYTRWTLKVAGANGQTEPVQPIDIHGSDFQKCPMYNFE